MVDYTAVKAALEAKLVELFARAADLESVLSDPGSSDWEENAVEKENDDALSAIGDVTKAEIRDITLALSRIENGQYDLCSSCGGHISPERLSALPWTNKCIRCA